MQCLVCNTAMLTREGKFGPFYYCPNGNHGTISVAKHEAIMNQFKGANDGLPVGGHDPLMLAIERQTMVLGGVMSDLERFYIDSEAYYDSPNDFWQTARPY